MGRVSNKKKNSWTSERRKAASEATRARLLMAQPKSDDPVESAERNMEAFQQRTAEVAERTEGGVRLLNQDGQEVWPSGAVKTYVHGHLIPEGFYHTCVSEIPASYGLGSAFSKIESSNKGYRLFKEIGPSRRIYICPQDEFDARRRQEARTARSRVVGTVKTPGSAVGPDVLSVTDTTKSGSVEVDAFLATGGRTQMDVPTLLAQAEQERSGTQQEGI